MRPPDLPPDACAETLGRLDAYLDDDLSADEARAFDTHCAACPACADELALALAVQDALRTWDAPACPDRVTEAAFAEIRTRRALAVTQRLRSWRTALTRPALRPALALATAALVALSLALLRPAAVEPAAVEPAEVDPAEHPTYTQAEVDQAVADVQRTLAILSDVGRRTGALVRDDVLEPHLVAPVQHTVGEMVHH